MPLQACPLPLFSLPLRGGLPNQKLDVGHVEGTIRQDFYQTEFHENLDCPLHGADLVPGKGGNGLGRVGKPVIQHEDTVVFEGHQVHLQKQIGIQQSILHTFQNHHFLAGEEILL